MFTGRFKLLRIVGIIIGILGATYLASQYPVFFIIAFPQLTLVGIGYLLGKKHGLAIVLSQLLILDFGWLFSYWLFSDWSHVGLWYTGLLGLFMLSLPAILFFWAGVVGMSFFTMPVEIRDWPKAARCLIGFITGSHYPYHVVVNGNVEERIKGKIMQKWQFPGIVLAEAHTAVPLSTGIALSRVAGPGVTFIRRIERPLSKQAMDLRVQLRVSDLHATTRDGIEVATTLLLAFSVEPQPPTRPPVTVRPYSEAAVFCAALTQRTGDDKQFNWDDVPIEAAKDIARQCIAKYHFDELLDKEEDSHRQHLARRGSLVMPRDRLRQEIEDQLKVEVCDRNAPIDNPAKLPTARKPYGIRIIGFDFNTIEPAGTNERRSILEQRVSTWQTEWEAEVRRRRAQVEAAEAHELGRARAQAQMRLIHALSEGFAQAKQAGLARPAEIVVLLRLLDAMEEMAQEPGTRELVPEEMQHVAAAIKIATAGRLA
jgi:hypothetical protein